MSSRIITGGLALLVVMCMLVSQALGLFHGLAHGPHHFQGSKSVAPSGHPAARNINWAGAVAPNSGTQNEVAQSWLSPLFSSHGSDADCRLFDQACHGSTMHSAPLVILPEVIAQRAIDISRSAALARWTALFNARGPPFSR